MPPRCPAAPSHTKTTLSLWAALLLIRESNGMGMISREKRTRIPNPNRKTVDNVKHKQSFKAEP
eukprot:275716-Pyramimonas_sp.AAC.2